jgi:hypothetical protein
MKATFWGSQRAGSIGWKRGGTSRRNHIDALIKEVRVTGMTPAEAEKTITELFQTDPRSRCP